MRAKRSNPFATHDGSSYPRRRVSSTPRLIGSVTAASGILDRPPQCASARKADDDDRIRRYDLAARCARAVDDKSALTAYTALSGDEFLLPPSPGGLKACRNPVGSTRLRQLDTSNGCQDHTALPYAASPVVRTLCSLTDQGPPCEHDHAPDAAASTATRPNVRDDGQRPSTGTGWREL